MYNILLFTGVLVLVFVCVLAVLFILMQRPNANAGMGSALGGAATESVFGGETTSVLTKATSVMITVFFLLCIGLYFAFVARAEHKDGSAENLNVAAAQKAVEKQAAAEEALYTNAAGEAVEVENSVPAEVVPVKSENSENSEHSENSEKSESVPAEQPAEQNPVPAENSVPAQQ